MKQVITPPILKLIFRGYRLEKSLAGETTFAATFTFSVANSNANIATTTAIGLPKMAQHHNRIPDGMPENNHRGRCDRYSDE